MNQGTNFKRVLVVIGIIISIYVILVEVLVSAELQYKEQGGDTEFSEFFDGIWYTVVTVSTVGYGKYVPSSPVGRGIGFFFVLVSITLYSYFVSKLTNYIAEVNENKKMGFGGVNFSNHTVILGWDNYSKAVADQLIEVGMQIAIVTTNKTNIDLIYEHFQRSKQVFVVYSEFDNYDLLRKAGIERSAMVFLNSEGDSKKLVDLLNLKKEFSKLKYIVTLDNSDLKDTFKSAGVTYPLSKHDLSSKLLASYIFEPDVAALGEELLSYAKTDDDNDIKEYLVTDRNPFVNGDYDEAFYTLKREYNTVLLGVSKVNPDDKYGDRILIKNPDYPVTIEKDDYLIMICNAKAEKLIDNSFGVEEGIFHY